MVMNDLLRHWLLSQAWPDPATDALVKVASRPEDQARLNWRAWKSQHDIDDCTWPQYKLLARISGRLPQVDPDCPEIPRLNGMAKAMWTQSQLRLSASAKALDVLQSEGIAVCLLKSAALEASRKVPMARRITSDLDIVVRREELADALRALNDASWTWESNDLQATFHRCLSNPGVNLKHGPGDNNTEADLDLHHQPVHHPFLSAKHLDQFWESTVSAVFRGQKVLIPGHEHMLVITAMQGLRRFIPSHLSSGLWPFDMMDLVAANDFDWDAAVRVAQQWRGTWQLLACLIYLEEQCQVGVPAEVIRSLERVALPDDSLVWFYAQSPTYGPLKYLNLPMRELLLLFAQQRFRSSAGTELTLPRAS